MTKAWIDLTGQCAVVTGGGHGLGRAAALDLAHRGAAVVVNDVAIDPETGEYSAEAVAKEIRGSNGAAVACTASVAALDGPSTIVATAHDAFGRCDVLIHSAARIRRVPLPDLTDDELAAQLAVNTRGAIAVTREAFASMASNEYGRIVLLGSGAGLFGLSGQASYGSSKAGLLGLTGAVSQEGAQHGIGINLVMPYAITNPGRTSLEWPAEDLAAVAPRATADHITPLITYLASGACTTSGEAYSTVGGRYARAAVAVADGWLAPTDAPPSPEQVRDHMDLVRDLRTAHFPDSFEAEFAEVATRLRNAAAGHPEIDDDGTS